MHVLLEYPTFLLNILSMQLIFPLDHLIKAAKSYVITVYSHIAIAILGVTFDALHDHTFLGGAKLRLLEWVLNKAVKVCKKRAETCK